MDHKALPAATLRHWTPRTAVLLWAAWAYISTFRGWSSNRVLGTIAGGAVIRIALVVLLLSWVFLS